MSELGKHWLLIRGLARESAHWGEFVPLLKSSFPEAKVTTLDLAGTGRFYQQSSPCSIEKITEQLRQHALEQGLLAQPITLCAVSLGAMVAWQWLKSYPQDCAGACLINTSFANLSPFYQRLRWQNAHKIISLLRKTDIAEREAQIVALVANNQAIYAQTSAVWAQIHRQRPIGVATRLKQLYAASRYQAGEKPLQPILLLNAQADRLVSPACSEAIAQHYGLAYRRHAWGGHDLTTDDGEWVIKQLREWLIM
ncbi:MAG: alpha/beta hydrolase [Methylococcaceae bacterium]